MDEPKQKTARAGVLEAELMAILLEEVVNLRRELGLTQKEFGAGAGITQMVVSRLENGTANTRLSVLLRLLAPLGLTLSVVPLSTRYPEQAKTTPR